MTGQAAVSFTKSSPSINDSSLIDFLENKEIRFRVFATPKNQSIMMTASLCGIDLSSIARAVILKQASGYCMAIFPASKYLDFNLLISQFGPNLEYATLKDLEHIKEDYFKGGVPPLPEYFGVKAIIDPSLYESETIYFRGGRIDGFLSVSNLDFKKLVKDSFDMSFTLNREEIVSVDDDLEDVNRIGDISKERIKENVSSIYSLPPIPVIANEILKLRVDPNADAETLARVVERDPSLASQLVSWASSPYYGYPGKITSVESAIIKVLGFDLVMNISIGICIGNKLKMKIDGPMGVKEFWRHSIFAAALIDKIISNMPHNKRPLKGLAYLCGLLHNIGYIILSELYTKDFEYLDTCVQLNQHIPVSKIENRILNVEHQEVGGWLMEFWNMPKQVIEAVRWHNLEYFNDKEDSIYTNLVIVANRLLSRNGIGDEIECTLSDKLTSSIGISEQALIKIFDNFIENSEDLNKLVEKLSS